MAIGTDSSLAGLATLIGEAHVATDPAICDSVAVDDLSPHSVAYPHSADDVAAVLAWARERSLAVIPCSNATKLHIGNIPRRYDVALCLKEMNRVPHYEPADLTASVEPGVKLSSFQQLLSRDGLWLPLDPPGGREATLGGIVATNAVGPARLKYSAPRDIVIGMKIATTEGKVVKTGGRVVKNVAGYDVAKLMAGSYGTLGAIVEISFKLFPLPAHRATWVLAGGGFEAAREFRRRVLASPLSPLRMVLLDRIAAAWARGQSAAEGSDEWLETWIEFGGTERVIQRSAKSLAELIDGTGATLNPIETDFASACWDRICDFSALGSTYFPHAVSFKASLPIAAGEEFVRRAHEEAGRQHVRAACASYPGAVHGCLAGESEPVVALAGSLREGTRGLGGSLVMERCSPELKQRMEVWGPPGDGFDVMRKLKEAWDPGATLSPGRFVGGL